MVTPFGTALYITTRLFVKTTFSAVKSHSHVAQQTNQEYIVKYNIKVHTLYMAGVSPVCRFESGLWL
jgi:hypothetical protein